jgi:DNA-binding response OmpR family regulator
MVNTVKKVLVVDDDQGVRRLASYVLTSAGFDVSMAQDGREALALIAIDIPDVVVLDLNMPIMDGYTLVHEMDRRSHRPPILILSADRPDRARQDLGAEASLSKPFRPDDLVTKVEALSGPAIAAD